MTNYVLFFEALGSHPRQKIIQIVRKNPNLTAGEISRKIPEISLQTVRHHISVLVNSGIFALKKKSVFVRYGLNKSFFKKVLSEFSKMI